MSQKYILKLSNLTDFLLNKISKKPNFIIAIDGRGGSGKSTLSKELSKKLPNSKLVQLDGILGDGELYTKENIEQGFEIDFSENRSSSEIIKAISNYQECEDKYIKNYQPQEKANIIYNIYKTKCT